MNSNHDTGDVQEILSSSIINVEGGGNEFKERLEGYSHYSQHNKNGKYSITAPAPSKSLASSQPQPPTIRNTMLNDRWIMIQKNTFTNWVNEQLKNENESIDDVRTDLTDGVKLMKLINTLQLPNPKVYRRRYFKNPINQHQCLENLTLALNAITEDGIRLVNIGNCDIANGNLKLILGLIWHLILRYQIGKTKIPPKKLIIAWIKSILPQIKITNLTRDLNDGRIIAGIVNYCNKSLCSDWESWNTNDKLENCTTAMNTALSELNIPLVVTPANMSSPELDELSSITYLSYFVKQGAPGYLTTLDWVSSQMHDEKIENFSTDWNDGWLLCKLSQKMGVSIPGYPNIDRTKKESNCQLGLNACKTLNIETYVSAKELSDPDVEHIGVMATLVQFKYAKPIKTANEKAKIYLNDPNEVAILGKPVEFSIEYSDTEVKNIKTVVKGPKSEPSVGTQRIRLGLLKCHFVPGETGRHELTAICDNHILNGCPIAINVKADTYKIKIEADEKCVLINKPVEICVNPMGAGKADVKVTTTSPSNRDIECRVEERDYKYFAQIYPDEVGEWITKVYYDNEETNDSPYTMNVFDPNRAKMIDFDKKSSYQINNPIEMQIDVSKVGQGKFSSQLINANTRQVYSIDRLKESETEGLFLFDFVPTEPGLYRCNLQFNNKHIKGSPIDFNVAVDTSHVAIDIEKCKSVLINQICSFVVDTNDNNQQGNVKAVVTNPDGNQIQARVSKNHDSTWRIEFSPAEIGEYFIEVFYANQLLAGSPFKCNVFDPSHIRIIPFHHGVVNQQVKFEVDASQAGSGQLEIAIENGRIPCTFSNQGNLKFLPAFTPNESGKHEITVKFNSYEVPGSPFFCNVVDVNKLTLISKADNGSFLFPLFKLASMELNANETSNNDINIKFTSPSRLQVPVTRTITPQNTMKLSFNPNEIGTYILDIDYASMPITGSPFEIKVYDASKINVSEVSGSEVNKECELQIDATKAGEGQLEIAVNDGQIKNQVKQIKPGQYTVSFLPTIQDNYVIDIKFNQDNVPGCPKRVFIRNNENVRLSGSVSENILVGSQHSFQFEGLHSLSDLSVRIKSPSDQEFVPKVSQISADECRVEWTPYELGTYTINAYYSDHLIKNTPFKVKTFDPKRVQVFDIQDGFVQQSNKFLVDASQSGEGSLEIGISCNGHYIPNQVKPIGNSRFEVHYTPQDAALHTININFNGCAVKGSPFQIKVIDTNSITAQGKGLGLIPIGKPTTFQILTGNSGASKVASSVTGPKGENIHVKLYQQSNGDYIGEFTPLSAGKHRIDILYANQPVAGSPFIANAYDIRTADITSLPKDLINDAENYMEVNLASLKNVDFEIKVTSPSGQQLPVTYEGTSYKKIRIVPNELGPHRVEILLGGEHIPGSPFTINSIDSRLPAARGDGLHHGLEDRSAAFQIESQGLVGNLDVKIEGPQHFTKNQIEYQNDGSYLIKYTPVEVGQYKIHAKWNDRDIPGSPFISYVVNPEKVKVVGGWQSILDYYNILNLKLHEERVINFDTSEAGPGTLNASILAPNGTKLPLRLTSQAQMYSLCFSALYEGEYKIHLTWDNYQLPNSPIIAKTSPQSDLSKIELNGSGLNQAKINQESEFVIDGSRAGEMRGLPEIKLTGTRCDIEVRTVQLGHNIYRGTYVPQIPGAYLLNIKWNDRQLGNSPYKVNVGMNSDPAKVAVSGDGIKTGVFGQEIKALIDTRRAGPGELTAHCMGPLKVAFCEFYDHKDGTFTLYVKPQEPGKHILQIKYNDDHVPGSPYVMRVSGAPDASKVKVIGPGICDGVLNKFKSRFICETKGAGAGQLTVRIRGPKGAFRVEMQRETQKERTILCKYDPVESGEYQVNIKWSGEHVPGSPFNVNIHKNDAEFSSFLKKNPELAYELQQLKIQHQQFNI